MRELRPVERVRQIERCSVCHGRNLGWTRIAGVAHGSKRAGARRHVCDECAAEAAAAERPLEAVLQDYLDDLA